MGESEDARLDAPALRGVKVILEVHRMRSCENYSNYTNGGRETRGTRRWPAAGRLEGKSLPQQGAPRDAREPNDAGATV